MRQDNITKTLEEQIRQDSIDRISEGGGDWLVYDGNKEYSVYMNKDGIIEVYSQGNKISEFSFKIVVEPIVKITL